MSSACGTCRWFDDVCPDPDPDEALETCEWPAERLPYALRWGNRERVMVRPNEGADCAGYEARDPAPSK